MGRVTIRRVYYAEAAHRLTAGVPEGHKCRRLHGHRYVVTVAVSGVVQDDGMVVEYADLDRVVRPIIKCVDHHDLNTLSERCSTAEAARVSQNPTVELLAQWLGVRLALLASARQGAGCRFDGVDVQEDADSTASFRP